MLYNTVEVFGGDTRNKIPENMRVVSSASSMQWSCQQWWPDLIILAIENTQRRVWMASDGRSGVSSYNCIFSNQIISGSFLFSTDFSLF